MTACTTPEAFTPYADTPGVCDACGKALVGRQQRWCSQECSLVEFNAHAWAGARAAAKRRDGNKCVTCGTPGPGPENRWRARTLEVNHIEPRVGQGYGWGCWNHPDNLETLCHDCHVAVTKAQAAERRAIAAAAEREAAGARALAFLEDVGRLDQWAPEGAS